MFGFDGERLFESLTTTDVQHLVLARRSEGNSNGTILVELSTLSQSIKLNKKLGYSVPNIDFAAIKKDNQIKPAKGKLRYLSKEEETKLLEQLDPNAVMNGIGFLTDEDIIDARQDVYDFVITLIDTGGRYSEIAELPWDDVNLKNRTINLYRSKVENESTIHMTDRVYETLKRRSEENDSGPRKYAAKAFNNACKRAGIKGITPHKLRHTHASRLVQKGVSLYTVQNLLGHASATTTQIYAHLVPNQASHDAAKILNSLNKE